MPAFVMHSSVGVADGGGGGDDDDEAAAATTAAAATLTGADDDEAAAAAVAAAKAEAAATLPARHDIDAGNELLRAPRCKTKLREGGMEREREGERERGRRNKIDTSVDRWMLINNIERRQDNQ
jgi:hypothetical protein